MPKQKRNKTKYPGVYWIQGKAIGDGKPERIYYISYRKGGKLIEEKAGRQRQDDMTPSRAAGVRTKRIQGSQPTNEEKRAEKRAQEEAEAGRWTIDRLWKEYKRQKLNYKGEGPDQNRYDKYIKPAFGEKEPHEILPLDVDRVRLEKMKGKAPQTIKLTLALLRRIANFGVKKRLSDPLPFTIEMPEVYNETTEDLSPEQLKSLLKSIEEDSHHQAGNIMLLALYSGMRRSEMFKLKWSHIDFEKGFIYIKDPKGGPDQKIPLNDAARGLLESLKKTRSLYVFPGRKGSRRTDINHQVSKIKNDAGLPKDFRPLHGLRHVYASMLASSGQVDMYTLQKLLTHKSPIMTQRYAHLRDEALKRASDLAGNIISDAIAETKEDEENKDKVVNLEDHKK